MIETNWYKELVDKGERPIYTITCLQKDGTIIDDYGWPDFGGQRTFGFEFSYEDAVEALNSNSCDMRECLYSYAIVERIFRGIHPDCMKEDRSWFKWDDDKKGFFETEEPRWSIGQCNFSIG